MDDEQKYKLVDIDYVYCVAEDGTENHFYDVYVELDGRRRKVRIRERSSLGKLVYSFTSLIQTLIDFER